MKRHVRTHIQSPFYSRAYGGFTSQQEVFYRDVIGNVAGKIVLDPMAGQGFALSRLAYEGGDVWLGDINPASVLLGSLRDPSLVSHSDDLVRYVHGILKRLGRRKHFGTDGTYIEDWLAPQIRRDLVDYAQMIGIDLFTNPFLINDGFWEAPPETRFATAIVLIAAREITCFRNSDNVTWLKPGGLLRHNRIIESVKRALSLWQAFVQETSHDVINEHGRLHSWRMDAENAHFGHSPKAHFIVTSPPYANRLDYTRLWAPESEVLAAMCGRSISEIKAAQIGTTVVENRNGYGNDERTLPAVVRRCLTAIRTDPTEFSDIYYYPFFRNYAVAITRAFGALSTRLRSGGTLIVFVRDTVRKDALFPTAELVTATLTKRGHGLTQVHAERRVIRQNIGFVRKAVTRGVYGLAQQEWWLVFKKKGR